MIYTVFRSLRGCQPPNAQGRKLAVESSWPRLCHHLSMPADPAIADTVASADKPRRILLAVTGMTPQVVTETLYALMQRGPQALPHELHLLTTAVGAERARLALLSEQPGWFNRFLADYRLAPIAFDIHHIHVLQDAGGRDMPDIRSACDNALAADQVAELVRRFTARDDVHLHVSLAGGRKTLGYFAGYALSLFGRDGDRLSHVLVSEPYESSWEFFYPTPYERIIKNTQSRLVDCAEAEVTLADIPFVRLRHGLPAALLEGNAGFAQVVSAAQAGLALPRLVLDLARQGVHAAGRAIDLAPADMAFLAWFARRAVADLPGLACPRDGVPLAEHATDYLLEYRRVRGVLGDDGRSAARYRQGMDKGQFLERRAKLNKALRKALGMAAGPYLVVGEGRQPMRYRLALPAAAISFA